MKPQPVQPITPTLITPTLITPTLITPTFTLLPGADQVIAVVSSGESALRTYPLRLMALRLRLGLVTGY